MKEARLVVASDLKAALAEVGRMLDAELSATVDQLIASHGLTGPVAEDCWLRIAEIRDEMTFRLNRLVEEKMSGRGGGTNDAPPSSALREPNLF